METWPLLSIVTFAPLVGALLILVMVRGDREATDRNARWLALWASLATFLISLLIWINFETGTADFQFVEKVAWFSLPGGYTLSYHMGVDGISMMFVLLSTLLTPICILCSWEVKSRVREYMAAFLVLETFMVGTFCALDLITFYVFFEGVLLPMFLIIGVWGGDRRVYSAFKFFLYTLLGSVLMLVAVMAMYFLSKSAGQGHHRYRRTAQVRPGNRLQPGSAEMAVARLLRVLRGEAADVAGSIPGCRTPMSRRRRPARSSWPASC